MGYQNVMSLAYFSKVAVGDWSKPIAMISWGIQLYKSWGICGHPGGQSTPKLRRHSTINKALFLKGSTNSIVIWIILGYFGDPKIDWVTGGLLISGLNWISRKRTSRHLRPPRLSNELDAITTGIKKWCQDISWHLRTDSNRQPLVRVQTLTRKPNPWAAALLLQSALWVLCCSVAFHAFSGP